MKTFLLKRNGHDDESIIANSFDVTELGAYFYKAVNMGKSLIAFYPIDQIMSITKVTQDSQAQ